MTGKRRSFGTDSSAVAAARQFVRSFLGDDPRTADAELVVSELATNALRHARSPFSVTLTLNPLLRIDVHDLSERLPVPRSAAPDALDGRGLQIVAAVASTWGSQLVPEGGKVVWAELGAR